MEPAQERIMRGYVERVCARIANAFKVPLRVFPHLELKHPRVMPSVVIDRVYERTQVDHSRSDPGENSIQLSNSRGVQQDGRNRLIEWQICNSLALGVPKEPLYLCRRVSGRWLY